MINFSRIKVQKMSELESSQDTSTSSRSSTSSFIKPELSKDRDCDHVNQIKNRRQRGQQRRKQDNSMSENKDNSLTVHNEIGLSPTSASAIDPIVKVVTFQKTARVRRVRPRNQYGEKERHDIWYGDSDYKEIKRRAVETVKRMLKAEKRGGFVDDDSYSARGLESRMKKNAIERKKFKTYARDLVLGEQEEQNDLGIICPGGIRRVYLKASSIALTKAQAAGRKDAEAVNNTSLPEILQIINIEHDSI
jgi:hypothetical protein